MFTKSITLASGNTVSLSQLTVREARTIDDKLKAASDSADGQAQIDASLCGIALSMNKADASHVVTADSLLDLISFGDMYDLNRSLSEINQMTIAKAGEAKAV
jgi:hypothetical protein